MCDSPWKLMFPVALARAVGRGGFGIYWPPWLDLSARILTLILRVCEC